MPTNPRAPGSPVPLAFSSRRRLLAIGGGVLGLGALGLMVNGILNPPASTPTPAPTPTARPAATPTNAPTQPSNTRDAPTRPPATATPATSMVVASSVRQVSADLVAITLVPGVEMEFVRIPAGEFLMGSDKSKDRDADPDELPQHILNLQEYWMSKGPVTATHFAPFGKPTGWRNPTIAEGENKANHPVVNVTWDDCTAFCFWAAKLTGFEIALASEAEWEKAARGPDGRLYPWGDEPPDATRLNYNHLVDTTTEQGKYGQRGRSPYGCDDMAGNVWEWTRSLWGKDGSKPEFGYPYTNRQTEREDLTAGRDVLRVLRGGSFNDDACDVRCASRFRLGPDSTSAASVFG